MKRNFEICFTPARVTASKRERYFNGILDVAFYENFQQNLESKRLQIKAINTLPAHDEETRHRIFDPNAICLLQGDTCHGAAPGNEMTKSIPVSNRTVRGVTAGYSDVISTAHCGNQGRQRPGWVL